MNVRMYKTTRRCFPGRTRTKTSATTASAGEILDR